MFLKIHNQIRNRRSATRQRKSPDWKNVIFVVKYGCNDTQVVYINEKKISNWANKGNSMRMVMEWKKTSKFIDFSDYDLRPLVEYLESSCNLVGKLLCIDEIGWQGDLESALTFVLLSILCHWCFQAPFLVGSCWIVMQLQENNTWPMVHRNKWPFWAR